MKRHIGYKLQYWRKYDINNKQTLKFNINTYNSIINEFGKIDVYIKTMISEPFDWLCLSIIKEV